MSWLRKWWENRKRPRFTEIDMRALQLILAHGAHSPVAKLELVQGLIDQFRITRNQRERMLIMLGEIGARR